MSVIWKIEVALLVSQNPQDEKVVNKCDFFFHNTLVYNADMFIDCTLNYFLVKSHSFVFVIVV